MVEDRRAHDPYAPPPRWETSRPATAPEQSRSDDAQAAGSGDDLEDMTKAELQDLAADKGLPTSGNKPDLIERLRDTQ